MDSDIDGIPNYFEEILGLDSDSNDTDLDGLHDYLEIMIPNISPISQDANQDGILDIYEDYDRDGLNNYDEEHLYYTDLSNVDTDNDGLTDKEEVDYGMNPTHKDTDGDKLR